MVNRSNETCTQPKDASSIYLVCPTTAPSASQYFRVISEDPSLLALFSCFGLMSAVTLLIYSYEIHSILRNKISIIRRIRMVILLSLYPVFSLLAFFAIIIPRAAPLLDLVANVYFAISLWHFIQLILMYYGGESEMIKKFGSSSVTIQTFPICCLFCCLPKFTMTKKFLRILKLGAGQFLIIRPVLLIIAMILWVEDKYEFIDQQTMKMKPLMSASTYISLVNMATTLFAIWPLVILFRASFTHLHQFHIKGKFAVFQLVMIFGSIQESIVTQLNNFNLLHCTTHLPSKSYALEVHHLAIIAEMLILSVAALVVYWKYIKENIPLDYQHPVNGTHETTPPTVSSDDGLEDGDCLQQTSTQALLPNN